MIETIIIAVILIFSIIAHEIAHGLAAYAMGDDTAKNAGKLSLNPIKHIDPFGSILLPGLLLLTGGFVIGWAKPVPVNPYNFKDKRYGDVKVSFAGPGTNLLIALIFGLLLRFVILENSMFSLQTATIFARIVQINIALAVFNLIPVPPLDGSHILFGLIPRINEEVKTFLMRYGMFVLVAIIVFLGEYIGAFSYYIFKLIVGI